MAQTKTGTLTITSEHEAIIAERQLARALRGIEQTRARAAERIDSINAEADQQVTALTERAIALAKTLEAYAEKELAFAAGKTVTFGTAGSVRWYDLPPSLEVDDTDALLAHLKKRRGEQYIRVKEEIDKAALLRALVRRPAIAEKLPGVRIKHASKIAVQPCGSELRVERPAKQKRWRVTR